MVTTKNAGLTKRPRCLNYPLLPLQQGILFHSSVENSPGNYLNQIIIALPERVQTKALTSAIQMVTDRHDSLRASIDVIKLEQKITPILKIKPSKTDLSAASAKKKQLRAWLRQDLTTNFDLTVPPLIRFSLIKLGSQDYQLVITHHHILLGGSSAVLMVKEIISLYDAMIQKSTVVLPEPLPYATCISRLQNQDNAAATAYWQTLLRDFEQPLTLPTTATKQASPCMQAVTHQLPQSLYIDLTRYSKSQHTTLNILMQIGWTLLLAHYCNAKDIVFGTTREFPRHLTKNALGLFLNTLPVRLPLTPQTTFKSLIELLKKQHRQQIQNLYLPLASLQALSGLPPGMPLFSTVFDFKQADPDHLMEGVYKNWRPRHGTFHFDTHYPLLIEAFERKASLHIKLHHDAAQFNKKFITQFINHYQHLLSQLITDLNQKVLTISIITEKEKQQLACWNDTHQPYSDKTVHELFMLQAQKTPDRVAAAFHQQQLTYRELDQQSNQLAIYLQQQGITARIPVVLCIERSLEMLVGLLGIMKAGGAYVPIDPHYPEERILMLLQDCGSTLILSQKSLLPMLNKATGRLAIKTDIIALDAGSDIFNNNKPLITKAYDSQNPVYIIYTSGSTGKPKGVCNRHQALVNRLTWMQNQYQLTPQDRVLQKTSIGFDVSFWEFFWPLIVGAQVVIAPVGIEQDAKKLAQFIDQKNITKLQLVPSMLQVFLEVPGAIQCQSLTHVFCIGEPLSPSLVKLFSRKLKKSKLTNLYGPTETAINVTYWDCEPDKKINSVPIGRPIANTQLYVVNTHGQLATCYMPGELYIGGVAVAEGYWQQPQMTAEKFIHNPYDTNDQHRLYKTGDRVSWLPDGNLAYKGRLDHQIKLRGFRIELSAIEHTLCQYPPIKQACVMIQGEDIGQYLVAYFTAEKLIAVTDIHHYLAAILPRHMLPKQIQQLDHFPLTTHGKINRTALQPLQAQPLKLIPRKKQQDKLGKIITHYWQAVLKVDEALLLPMNANFFNLGGNSLTAMQVIARLNVKFAININANALFIHPTLNEFIHYIREQTAKSDQETRGVRPIQKRPQQIPLSFSQQRLWFLEQLYPNQTTYQLFIALELTGDLQIPALKKAFLSLVERHEILRTTFANKEGQITQIIHKKNLSVLIDEDASHLSTEAITKTIHEMAQTPFDLTTGPLIKAKLLQRQTKEYLLLMSLHHIICDGWSMNLLGKELSTLYANYAGDNQNQLPTLPIQYADYAIWSRNRFNDVHLAPQLKYWQQQLQHLTTLNLPSDHPRPKIQQFKGERIAFTLPSSLTQALQQLSKGQHTTLFNTLSSAFSLLLARLSGQQDIAIGTPVAGRHHSNTEDIIGLFVNMLVLRSQFKEKASFIALLEANHQMLTAAYANQDVPFEKVIEQLSPTRDMSRHPLCQVLIVMQNFTIQPLQLCGIQTQRVFGDNDTLLLADYESSKFDLTLYLQEKPDCLEGLIEYNTDLFKATTITRYIGYFKQLLAAIIDSPRSSVMRLPLLSQQEQQQLLVEWNDTQRTYPTEKNITQLIETQAKKNPQQPAIIFKNQTIRYLTFNYKVNQLAHFLRQKGAERNVFVGVFLDRSIEMVISIAAILKAGAAYLPITVSIPQNRLHAILTDSQPRLIITAQAFKTKLIQATNQVATTIICLEEAALAIEKCSQENLTHNPKPNDFSYMIYTSGSTGKPKGVINYHRGTLNRLLWMQETFSLAATDRVLQKTPINFDVSIWEIFWPLISGATLVLAEPQLHQDVNYLTDLVIKQKITVIHFVPSMLAAFLEFTRLSDKHSLHQVFVSGEVLTPNLQQQFFEHFKQVTLHNLYGPTEASIDVTYWQCLPTREAVPIGRAIANTKIYIVDQYLNLVPIGVTGEIYIAGVGLAWGYHHQPQLTQQQFIDNPFDAKIYPKLYRSGDLGRWLDEGTIEYIGRIDRQIKIRGVRIEPGEIETILLQHPSVKQVAVLADPSALDQQLVAYIVMADHTTAPTFEMLYQFLQQHLPNTLLPTAFNIITALPLANSGKVDWQRLSQLTIKKNLQCTQSNTAKNDVQKKLAILWAKALNKKTTAIDINQDFFQLGGHSLLALKIIAAIQKTFQVDISTRDFFEASTIAQLSQRIKQKHLEKVIQQNNLTYIKQPNSPLVTLQPHGNKTPLFLFHPVGGTVFCYMPLVSYLRKDRPCYAIQDPGIEASQPLYKTIKEMAADYLQIVKSVQPEGPYMLGGSSFGGTIAVEMAHQLIKAGEKIAFLPLFDLWALFTDEFRSRKRLEAGMQRQFNMLKKRLKTENVPAPEPWLALNWQRMNLWLNYRPPIIDTKLTLFKAKELLPEYLPIADHTNHWQQYSAQPIDVHPIPGNHETIHLEPNVQVLAKWMQHCIDKLAHISDNKTIKHLQNA